jgi:hypothetical protein
MQGTIKKLIYLIIFIVIIGLLMYCVRLVLPMLGLPDPINTVIWILICIFIILAFLNYMGMFGNWNNNSNTPS